MSVPPPPRRIAAIGGGGVATDDTRGRRERWRLGPTGRPAPRVPGLGTAGGDGQRGAPACFRMSSGPGARPSVLPVLPSERRRDDHRAAIDADLVRVGGGDTVAMRAVWRASGSERSPA